MKYETISLRDYVGKTLNALYDPRMYVLDGDLSSATRSAQFQQEHPDHFIECGISETSGVSIATGLAHGGHDSLLCQLCPVLHGQRVDTGAHGLLCGCEPEAAVHPPRHG